MKIIALDGCDGCSKTTQTGVLADWLYMDMRKSIRKLQMPGASSLGKDIRTLVKSIDYKPCPVASRLLFAADTAQMFHEMSAYSETTDFVVADRFSPITDCVYGQAEGLEFDWLDRLQFCAGTRRQCDLFFLFVISAEEAAERKASMAKAGHQPTCRIESMGESFLTRVANGYQRIADYNKVSGGFPDWVNARAKKTIVIDASQEREAIRDQIREHVKQEFSL